MTKNFKIGLSTALITFLLAILLSSSARVVVASLSSPFAFSALFGIILMGVIFDAIGVAAAVATEAPFNARAARKDFGAKEGLYLVKNSDRVATFCSDIVGDICGTVGGALAAILALRIAFSTNGNDGVINTVLIAAVASLTVGGKGFCKGIAIRKANQIIALVGNIIARSKEFLFWSRKEQN